MGKTTKLLLIGIAAVPGAAAVIAIAAAVGAMLAIFLLVAAVGEVIGGA